MGFIIYKINAGINSSDPQTKEKIILTVSRVCEILYTSAEKTINIAADGPMEIQYKSQSRSPITKTAQKFTPDLIKDLVKSEEFSVKINAGEIEMKFSYDQEIHGSNSINLEMKTQFKESIRRFLFGLILDKEIVGTAWAYERAADRVERLKELTKSVFKKTFGENFFFSVAKSTVHQYMRDTLYFNFFGYQFAFRRRF